MQTIKVKKSDLVDKITSNRDVHKTVVNEAFAAYREKAINELDVMIQEAKAGKRIRRGITLVEPVDQTREYDAALAKLAMSVDDIIEIEDHEFQCLILDNWAWKGQFMAANSGYSATLQSLSR